MPIAVVYGLLLPFLGTALGAGCVLFLRGDMPILLRRGLTGFAAGVMMAASIWSLLVPAIDECEHLGRWAFLPAFMGFWAGILFLLLLDQAIPHLHMGSDQPEGPRSSPEGIAVGVIYAGLLTETGGITATGALALSLGIAIQNFPEGAIVSMPLASEGMGRGRALCWGILSGVVEPVGALAAIGLAELVLPALPYLLSFAAGAMVYVVVEELIPESAQGAHWNLGTLCFAAGFTIMMALDVALG